MTSQAELKDNKSFTLIELLIVIAITLILAVAAIPIYGNLQVSSQLSENSSQIIQTLRTARERAAARLNNEAHGVQFQENSYTLYQNSPGAGYDKQTILDDVLTLSWDLTGGVDRIAFSRGLGLPDAVGTITLTHDVAGARTIIINSFGMVEKE